MCRGLDTLLNHGSKTTTVLHTASPKLGRNRQSWDHHFIVHLSVVDVYRISSVATCFAQSRMRYALVCGITPHETHTLCPAFYTHQMLRLIGRHVER